MVKMQNGVLPWDGFKFVSGEPFGKEGGFYNAGTLVGNGCPVIETEGDTLEMRVCDIVVKVRDGYILNMGPSNFLDVGWFYCKKEGGDDFIGRSITMLDAIKLIVEVYSIEVTKWAMEPKSVEIEQFIDAMDFKDTYIDVEGSDLYVYGGAVDVQLLFKINGDLYAYVDDEDLGTPKLYHLLWKHGKIYGYGRTV